MMTTCHDNFRSPVQRAYKDMSTMLLIPGQFSWQPPGEKPMKNIQATPADVTEPENSGPALSRRGFGKHLLLGASAVATLLATSNHEQAQAAPITDDWHLGGNTNVS